MPVLAPVRSRCTAARNARASAQRSHRNAGNVPGGVDFLGYRHFPAGYLLLRKSTAKRMLRRVRALPWELRHGKTTKERALSSVMSMKGWMRWANTHHLALSMKLDELETFVRGWEEAGA